MTILLNLSRTAWLLCGISIAGRHLDAKYDEGIFVAAIDMDDGTEQWGYGLTSDNLNLYGFDADRSGNLSLMGSNYNTQDLEGITEAAEWALLWFFPPCI